MRFTRWLIVLPAVVLSFFPFVANADPVQGLATTYYSIDEIPPQQSTSEYPVCGTELENNINRSYDGEPFENCTGDLFMVHMTGFITIPEHTTIEFWLASDDGGQATIGGNTWGSWTDQGCSAWQSGNLSLQPGSQPLTVWMYENGGATCLMLAWKIDDNEWEIVPDEAFTTSPVASTTTEVSTTTVAESTTSSVPTTTSLPVEPTMPEQSTTTTTTTTSTVVATTTTTEVAAPPVAQPPATVPPPPTTQPAPPDTEPTPPNTEPSPPETAPQPPETAEATLPPVDDTSPPDAPQAPETLPILDTVPAPPETVPAPPADTTPAEEPLTEAEFEAVIEQLSEATEEQIVAIIDDVITKDLDTTQAAAFVSNSDVLAAITTDQAEALFEEITTDELTVEQAAEVVAAVQDAPSGVRKAFESVLNIFSGFADNYVPFDSRIPVSERRALVALGAVLLAASPAPTLRRRQ